MKKLLFILIFSSATIAGRSQIITLDSLGTNKTYLIIDSSDHLQIVGDTMTVIKSLLGIMAEQGKKLAAAQKLLSNVTTLGFVWNRNRLTFNKAVKEYYKIMGYTGKIEPMQPLDILVRNLDGTAAGWIKQQ